MGYGLWVADNRQPKILIVGYPVVSHTAEENGKRDSRFQIVDFRFQKTESRFQIADRTENRKQKAESRFQIADCRFQIADFRKPNNRQRKNREQISSIR